MKSSKPISQIKITDHPLYREFQREIDPIFYRAEYPDLSDMSDIAIRNHYATIGWIEGRNPNAWFDTFQYLSDNNDVKNEHICPLFHYTGWGKGERRHTTVPVSIREINNIIFLGKNPSWVGLIRTDFDSNFYKTQLTNVHDDSIDMAAHYLFTGWREGIMPRANFERSATTLFAADIENKVPPLILELAIKNHVNIQPGNRYGVGWSNQSKTPAPSYTAEIRQQLIHNDYNNLVFHDGADNFIPSRADISNYFNDEINLIAEYFDRDFYLAKYSDVRDAGIDCIEHYFYTGWKEYRDPTPWFNTQYYLDTYPDIMTSGVNPFWHYIVAGRQEGRLPRSEGSAKRLVIERAKQPEVRTEEYATPEHKKISKSELSKLINNAAKKATGIVVAVSHDCYRVVTGGVQIFISDEQIKFNMRGFIYIHLSPLRAALYVKDEAPDSTQTRIVINGKIEGVSSDREIADVLAMLSSSLPEPRIFVVHSPLGHSVLGLIAIFSSLQTKKAYCWVHDYTSLCTGFHLLRNDVQYCGAPDMESEGCRICIYGLSRKNGHKLQKLLFEHCNFTIVAPSEITRQIWLDSSCLPHKGILVVEHAHLSETEKWLDLGKPHEVGTKTHPVRVAYIGYPTLHKGWLTFERILDQSADYANYNFFHFGSSSSLCVRKNLRAVESTVQADERDVMTKQLRKNGIDFVVIAAEWPETFSYVAFEALAAGCDIVTLGRSGNVAAVVTKLRRGIVFEHEDEIVKFFASGDAIAYARARAAHGAYASDLLHKGTTAVLI